MPARLLVPRRVPVLARTCPRAAGVVSAKRYSSDPVKPATGSPVSTGRSVGWSADAAALSTPSRVSGGSTLSRDSPLPSYQSAPPTGTSSSVRACRTPVTPPSNDPSPTVASPTWWASTSAASLSLTVSIRSTICDTGGTLDLGERRGGAGRATPYGRAGQPDAGRAQLLGEVRRRGQRRVRHPSAAGGGSPLVGPQRGDGGDHAVGDVARLPVRVDLRAGEQGVVVAERRLADPLVGEGGGRQPGEGAEVGARRGTPARPSPPACSRGTGRRRRPARPAAALPDLGGPPGS